MNLSPALLRQNEDGTWPGKPMNVASLSQDDLYYLPIVKTYLGDRAPVTLTALGNLDILQQKKLALFCSVQCPGPLILQTYDLARALRHAGVTVISGFHSPMEKECLNVLLRGTQPVIVCPARSIERMRLPAEWKAALVQDRLLLLSPFAEQFRRVTTKRAHERNEFVAALADTLLIAYAAPGGKIERFCQDIRSWGKPLLALESSENANLLALGARGILPENIGQQWRMSASEMRREGVNPVGYRVRDRDVLKNRR
jgi:predicted Rossmann fold nucleotide-binding protein DprA/Smf involved in DNA uptake